MSNRIGIRYGNTIDEPNAIAIAYCVWHGVSTLIEAPPLLVGGRVRCVRGIYKVYTYTKKTACVSAEDQVDSATQTMWHLPAFFCAPATEFDVEMVTASEKVVASYVYYRWLALFNLTDKALLR